MQFKLGATYLFGPVSPPNPAEIRDDAQALALGQPTHSDRVSIQRQINASPVQLGHRPARRALWLFVGATQHLAGLWICKVKSLARGARHGFIDFPVILRCRNREQTNKPDQVVGDLLARRVAAARLARSLRSA
jgi:hypothetical protein